MAPVSLKDMERYTSPWAVAAEDEDKFERTVRPGHGYLEISIMSTISSISILATISKTYNIYKIHIKFIH